MKRAFTIIVTALLGMNAGPLSAQVLTTLYSFTNGIDGADPFGGVILSGGTLYGTAGEGGSFDNGTIFSIATNGSDFSMLYSFSETDTNGVNSDGANPVCELVLSGNTLYGTAEAEGSFNYGTIFSLTTNGTGFTNLHNFTGVSDGFGPIAGLFLAGNTLYGTALNGGTYSDGTVFAVNTNASNFITLHTFTPSVGTNGVYHSGTNSDGANPQAGLILSGNTLYGAAIAGGAEGNGTVFAVNTNGSNFITLHSFTAAFGTNGVNGSGTNSDGTNPIDSLILAGDMLFGAASGGGIHGDGTVFAVNTNGSNFTVLHSFSGFSDGASPGFGLILSGNVLYGTADQGGISNVGTIFSLDTNGSNFARLYTFTNGSDGGYPGIGSILSNRLYGTTRGGGSAGFGTVFAFNLSPSATMITWTNTAGGNWSVATNWSPNQVPGPSDDVSITNAGSYVVTLDISPTVNSLTLGGSSGQQTLATAGYNLSWDNAGVVSGNGVFQLSGGLLNGNLTVNGQFDWTSGQIGSGNFGLTVASNGSFVLEGQTDADYAIVALTNAGTVRIVSGGLQLDACDGAGVLVNLPGGLVDIQTDGVINSCLDGTIDNEGTFQKSGGINTTAIGDVVYFNNTGTLIAKTGTISLGNGAYNGGTITNEPGASLVLNGGAFTGVVNGVLNWTGGSIATATVAANGLLVLEGQTNVDYAIAALTNAGTVRIVSGGLQLDACDGAGVLVNLPGGLVDIQTDGVINSCLGATIDNEGTFQKSGGINTTAIGDVVYFSNTGILIVKTGTISLGNGVYNGGTITNEPGASLVLNGGAFTGVVNGVLNWTGGSIATATVAANGLLVLEGQTNVDYAIAALTNAGTVRIVSGGLQLDACDGAGVLVNLPGGLVDIQTDGVINSCLGATIDNEGTFQKSGGINTTAIGDVVYFSNTGILIVKTGTISLGNGVYNGGTITNEPGASLVLNGGAFTGVVNGVLNWTGGSIATATVAANGLLVLEGQTNVDYAIAALTNAGTVRIVSGGLQLDACDGAGVLVNLPGGLVDIQTDGVINSCLDGTIDNEGTFQKSGGINTTAIGDVVYFNNTGILSVQSGMVTLGSGYSLAGGTLNFGITSLANFGVINLAGNPAVLAGTISVNLNGNYVPSVSNAFQVLNFTSSSGEFTSTDLPPVAVWQTTYNPANVTLTVLKLAPPPAPVLTILHVFSAPNAAGSNMDGVFPEAGLTASGNTLYGTAYEGGPFGDGVVFAINTDGSGFHVLHNFTGADGSEIAAGLVMASNTLYGAAGAGGANSNGTLFSLGTDGFSFTNIYAFSGQPDSSVPNDLLMSGNMFFATSRGGGSSADGTVFSVDTNGSGYDLLYSFSGLDGSTPNGNLVLGGNVLYGTTYTGGAISMGEIFSIQTDGSNFALLQSCSNLSGTHPKAGLVLSGATLYGTAENGGAHGQGTIFSIDTNGSDFTVLHTFNSSVGDGASPSAALFLSGNVLYGTTLSGGPFFDGTVFSIDTDGSNYTQLYTFGTNSGDGAEPISPVILVGNSLYGTTYVGGSNGYGTVFRLQIAGVAFTLEPVGATNVAIGSNVVFTGVGESLSMPTATIQYQWRLNGVVIAGATTTELAFQDVQATNGGTLTLTISDGINAATSVPVGLTVAIPTLASGNTNFAGRFELTEAASSVVGSSNTNGTPETGEPQIISGNPGGKPIWFEWQPTNSGTAVFTTLGSDFDTILGVYTGTNIGALTRLPSCVNDDDSGGFLTSKVLFNCVAGTAYEIVVDGYWGVSGNVVLSWVTEDFAEPLPSLLAVPPRQTVASNGAAVTLFCQPDSGVPSWILDGQATGVTGPDFPIIAVGDTNVGTYIAETTLGGAVASTQPAHVQFNVLEDGTSDTNSIAWNKFLDSANSPYSNPPQASIRKLGGGGDTRGYSVSQTFGTVGAVAEPGEPTIDGQIGGSPYWYTYIPPTNGAMRINTAGSLFNTMLGVFIGSGKTFASLTNIGAAYTTNRLLDGQPQVYVPNVVKGQTYSIEVDGYKGVSGLVELNIYLGNPVVIDTPPQSQAAVAGSNVTFTVDADGSIPLSYMWQFNGLDIPGATNSTFTVSDVQATNTGLYTVVISNLVSVTSNSATLSPMASLMLESPSLNRGAFQVQLAGAEGGGYVLQVSTNLLAWTSLTTNSATNGFLLLTDTNAGNFNARFYRVVTE